MGVQKSDHVQANRNCSACPNETHSYFSGKKRELKKEIAKSMSLLHASESFRLPHFIESVFQHCYQI